MSWAVVLGAASLAVTAVGVGMQYSANQTAAANQAAMAKYNYAIQSQNVKQQQALAEWQAKAQANNLNAQGAAAMQAAETNAKNLDTQAEGALSRGIENSRRTREDQLRFSAIQRASIAKSGVVTGVGTPLTLELATARDMALTRADEWYGANAERSSLLSAAEMERYGGRIGQVGYGNQAAMVRAEGSMAPIQARMQMREANMNKLIGLNNAAGAKTAANAGLVSGFGTLLGGAYSMYDSGAFGNKVKVS